VIWHNVIRSTEILFLIKQINNDRKKSSKKEENIILRALYNEEFWNFIKKSIITEKITKKKSSKQILIIGNFTHRVSE